MGWPQCSLHTVENTGINSELILASLERLRAHPLFVRSVRVRRFLEFTVGYALSGRGEEIKEYLLGVEVFDRTEAHDPRLDPIVRVEARRVRAKLQSYYQTVGAEDPLVIEYPPGSYIPRFRLRHAAAPALLAVLPFAPQCERWCARFAEGLTRELIAELGRSPAIRLFAAGSDETVEVLLTGTVRRAGPRVQVTAQLLRTGNSRSSWSESFESNPGDSATAQKQIAFAAAHSLSRHLRP
jgi:TolB-like protein